MFFFFKQKTAYEMRISDWSSDVCSSDLDAAGPAGDVVEAVAPELRFDGSGGDHDPCRGCMEPAHHPVGPGRRKPGSGLDVFRKQIGRASCRARVCQYV